MSSSDIGVAWLDRVKIEAEELEVRVDKLGKFFDSEGYRSLGMDHKILLTSQLMAMCSYLSCLKHRILLADKEVTDGISEESTEAGC